jgi:hypothetical protein
LFHSLRCCNVSQHFLHPVLIVQQVFEVTLSRAYLVSERVALA